MNWLRVDVKSCKLVLGHEGDVDGFPVEGRGHVGDFGDIAAVHEPEAGRHGGRERHAVIHERQRRRAGHVLPLGLDGTTCHLHVISTVNSSHSHIIHNEPNMVDIIIRH